MLEHEPLCPSLNRGLINPHICTYCQLIRTVIAVERGRQFPDPFTGEDK